MGRERALAAAAAICMASSPAVAQPAASMPSAGAPSPVGNSLILLPTATEPGGSEGLAAVAHDLDALLADAARDLGLALAPPSASAARATDMDLTGLAQASQAPVVQVRLRAATNSDVEFRIACANPGAAELDIRHARVTQKALAVRSVTLLRDVLRPRIPLVIKLGSKDAAAPKPSPVGVGGRTILIANSGLFGGVLGYSIERGSGSSDPRLVYPLLAVGTGIGVGAAYLASTEWDVESGDAWFFTAGALYPTLAGHLIFQGRFSSNRADSDRWVFGLAGGVAGAALTTLGLTLHPISDGSALVAHTGGVFGMAFGAFVDLTVRGDTHVIPYAGLGYGAVLGWLGAATLALQVHPPAMRVLAVDVGTTLAGLAGAAIASPLMGGHPGADRQRAFLGVTAGAALVGTVTSVLLTRSMKSETKLGGGAPMIGVLGESVDGRTRAPIWGAGWQGSM